MTRYFTLTIVATIGCVIFLLLGCAKKSSKEAGPNYTDKMGGMRNWHRWSKSYYTITSSSNATTGGTYVYPDTSFSLIIINRAAVKFFGKNYEYDTINSTSNIYYFGKASNGISYKNGDGLVYYRAKDSILFISEKTSSSDHYETRYYTF